MSEHGHDENGEFNPGQCVCSGPGYCELMQRHMSEARHKECHDKPGFYEAFWNSRGGRRWQEKQLQKRKQKHDYSQKCLIDQRMRRGRLISFTQALLRGIRHPAPATPKMVEQRQQACETCEFRRGNTCDACGCSLKAKRAVKAWNCPFAKWAGDEQFYAGITKPHPDTFAVGMTTCPRTKPTLQDSLDSLAAAGFEKVYQLDDTGKRMGAWNNFRNGLANLIAAEPDSDCFLMFQDDVMVSANLRAYLERSLWPEPRDRVGVCALYCSYAHHKPDELGWERREGTTWGALGYAFTPLSARLFVSQNVQRNTRARRVDKKVSAAWCQNAGLDFYVHQPSLIQHTGRTSTLGNVGVTTHRRARVFLNDALDLIRGEHG